MRHIGASADVILVAVEDAHWVILRELPRSDCAVVGARHEVGELAWVRRPSRCPDRLFVLVPCLEDRTRRGIVDLERACIGAGRKDTTIVSKGSGASGGGWGGQAGCDSAQEFWIG